MAKTQADNLVAWASYGSNIYVRILRWDFNAVMSSTELEEREGTELQVVRIGS